LKRPSVTPFGCYRKFEATSKSKCSVTVSVAVPISVAVPMVVVAVSLLAFIFHRVTLEIVGIAIELKR
jgi:hypothetical protein